LALPFGQSREAGGNSLRWTSISQRRANLPSSSRLRLAARVRLKASDNLGTGENQRAVLVPHSAAAILDGMRDVFACIKCLSIYEITRHRRQPLARPRCQVCHAPFPPSELGDWLSYQRAEPEWRVGEWLGVHASQFSRPSPDKRGAALVQRRVPTSEWPLMPAANARRVGERCGSAQPDSMLE
jgi:hypothetical protein